MNNNLSRTEGELIPVLGSDGKYQYSKVDTINMTGNLEKVYESSLTTNSDLIIEEKEFNETLQETNYFFVYEFLESNRNQDSTQGKGISGKVTVSLQRELSPLKPLKEFGIEDTLTTIGNGLYEVTHDDAEIGTHMNATQRANLKETEYRYAGSNPNNYIKFNNELWRIIGLVNTPEGQRIKLVRDEAIGKYSWDTSESSINSGYGINEWSQSDLMKLLNPGYESETIGGSLYWNSQNGSCYNGENNAIISCNFSNIGLFSQDKSIVDNITWMTGVKSYGSLDGDNTKKYYDYERNDSVGKICSDGVYCNDKVNRTTTWNGKIGLVSLSDYGYASSGGDIANRNTCINTNFGDWENAFFSDCYNNSWLFRANQWSMNPISFFSHALYILAITPSGNKDHYGAYYNHDIYPSLYLTKNQKVIKGDGNKNNPYQLM